VDLKFRPMAAGKDRNLEYNLAIPWCGSLIDYFCLDSFFGSVIILLKHQKFQGKHLFYGIFP
jgi:hypothetical protein